MVLYVNRYTRYILATLILLLTLPFYVEAADDMWDGVFRYQQKLANYGKPEAQVKLGEMYEEGHGVEQSFDTGRCNLASGCLHWHRTTVRLRLWL